MDHRSEGEQQTQMDGEAQGCQHEGYHRSRWVGLAIGHLIRINYFLTFKVMDLDVYMVTIFNYSCSEVVMRCAKHDPTFAMKDE